MPSPTIPAPSEATLGYVNPDSTLTVPQEDANSSNDGTLSIPAAGSSAATSTSTLAEENVFDPHKTTFLHWHVLFLTCMLVFGNFYSYDIPGALNVQLQSWLGTPYDEYQLQFNLLYSVYSIPNIILPFVGGFLVDKLGPSRMLVVFTLCIIVGQSIFAYGVSSRTFWIMVLGRVVFGLGGESLEVVQVTVATDWFKGRGLAFALAITLASSRIATALNDNVSPLIQEWKDTGVATWSGTVLCVVSGACGIWLLWLDRPESRRGAGIPVAGGDRKGDEVVEKIDEDIEAEIKEDDEMKLSDIVKLNGSFWCLCVCGLLLYASVVPFFHISSDFLQSKWYPSDPRSAGTVMSIPHIVSAAGSPICGYIIDRVGRRSLFLPVSSIILLASQLLLGFSFLHPAVGLVLLGIGYSIFATTLWPCVPYIVGEHQLGTAYGILAVALNVSMTVFPLLVSQITASAGGFEAVMSFFAALSGVSMISGVALYVLDARDGGPLQKVYLRGDPNEKGSGGGEGTSLEDVCVVEPVVGSIDNGGGTYGTPQPSPETVVEEEMHMTTRVVGDGIVALVPHRRARARTHHRRSLSVPDRDNSEGNLARHSQRCRSAGGGASGGRTLRRRSSQTSPVSLTVPEEGNIQSSVHLRSAD